MVEAALGSTTGRYYQPRIAAGQASGATGRTYSFAMQPGDAHVTYIGHATVLIQLDGRLIITDPILRDRLMALQRHGLPLEGTGREPGPVQIILLSHMHYDHADLPSLRRLSYQATVIAPRGAGLYLRTRIPQPILELSPGESAVLGPLTITATPAAHPGGRPLHGMATPAVGYLVRGSQTVYFAGDTDLFDEMRALGQRGIDIAFLPVAGYTPRVPSGHLTPLSAARAVRLLQPRLAIPIHWGAFRPLGPLWQRLGYLQDPPYTFVGYASQMAPETEVRVLLPGQGTSLAALAAGTT